LEFVDFMEDMWMFVEDESLYKCDSALEEATAVFSNLFSWLDKDGDKFVSKQDLMFGLSKIMGKDANEEKIELSLQDSEDGNLDLA
jgi:Ca2+-binding EF-hand superfamily protein